MPTLARTSTSTGTGNFTFVEDVSTVLQVNDVFDALIFDANYNQWENVNCTYLGNGVFSRDVVDKSSNNDALVNFIAGVKNIKLTLTVGDTIRNEANVTISDSTVAVKNIRANNALASLGQILTSNGTANYWATLDLGGGGGGIGPVIGVQVLAAGTTTYTPSLGTIAALGFAQGAGGGGGGVGSTSGLMSAGGGCAGETRVFAVNPVSGTYPVTVGSAGTGAAAGNNPGGVGGDTTFGINGSICTAKGGAAGTGSTGATWPTPGTTPTGSGGAVIPPALPSPSNSDYLHGGPGRGAATIFGMSMLNVNAFLGRATAGTGAVAGNNYVVGIGAGGTGGSHGGTSTTTAGGGDGGDGQILMIEFGAPGGYTGIIPPRGYLYGMGTTYLSSNTISVAPGQCADTSGNYMITLANTLTKNVAAAWASGNNVGGLDTGAITNNTYHVYVIANTATGNTDFCFSTSNTLPTMPANFNVSRRVGSVIRTGGVIKPYRQYDDHFVYVTNVADRSSATAVTDILIALTVPNGIKVRPVLQMGVDLYSVNTCIVHIDLGNGDDPNTSTTEAGTARIDGGYGVRTVRPAEYVWTNTAKQIRFYLAYEAGGAGDVEGIVLLTTGYIDPRGRGGTV